MTKCLLKRSFVRTYILVFLTECHSTQCWAEFIALLRLSQRKIILKEINPEYLSEGLMLKLQYFGHLMQKADSLEKTLMLGKVEGRRRRGTEDEMVGWHHRLSGHEFE